MIALRRLAADRSGVTAVEFGLIAPVFLMGLLGVFDLGHTMYTESMLTGSIQKAARDSTIEGASINEDQLDDRVRTAVHAIAPGADVQFKRRSYSSFSDVATPEDYTDVNANGACDDGDPFEDANGNGQWDADRGAIGFGGARDAVLYTVRVRYERFFPIYRFINLPETSTLEVSSVLRNQPWSLQEASAPTIEHCT